MAEGVLIHGAVDLRQSTVLPHHDDCHRVTIDLGCVFIHTADEVSL